MIHDGTSNQIHQSPSISDNQKIKRKKKETKESYGTIRTPSLSFMQMENRCYACGQSGHTSTKCAHKSKIPMEEWAINLAGTRAKSINCRETSSTTCASGSTKFRQHYSNNPHDETSSGATTTNYSNKCKQWNMGTDKHAGWGNQCTNNRSFSQTHAQIRDWSLLESKLCVDYFTNPLLLNYVQDSNECLMLSTNSGQNIIKSNPMCPNWWSMV